MKKHGFVTLAASVVLLLSSSFSAFAQEDFDHIRGIKGGKNFDGDYIVSSESVEFLKSHKVDVTAFKKANNAANDKIVSKQDQSLSIAKSDLYDENIKSFKSQVEANKFTDEQIQQYVKGMLENEPVIVNSKANVNAGKNPAYSVNRPTDDGIGYEVESKSGYYLSTAYATLPSVNKPANTSAYMFWTVGGTDGYVIDVGLWYSDGYKGLGWRADYNTVETGQIPVNPMDGPISGLYGGKDVYMSAQVRSDGYLEFKCVDAYNFSIVYTDFIYYVGNHIWTTNGIFNRQITLCDSTRAFNNGAYMTNAKFSQAYLYSNSGYYKVSSDNTTIKHGAFGTNDSNRNKVTVNSYTAWDSENVSINY